MFEENTVTTMPLNSAEIRGSNVPAEVPVITEPIADMNDPKPAALPEIPESIEKPEPPKPVNDAENQTTESCIPAESAAEENFLSIPAEVPTSEKLSKPSAHAVYAEPIITSLDELKSLEVLRTEFASSMFKPKVILSYETISFNKACVNLLPDARYVNVLIDREKKRIIILPVNKHAKDALQWCGVTRTGEVQKRQCTAKKFGERLYNMMQWIKENKYRILAYYQEVEGVRLLVFNLRECEMVVPDFITTKSGKVIKRGRVYLPGDYDSGFGMPLVQHSEANAVELDAHYTLSDKDMNVTIADVRVRGKVPTDEELIMLQYRKEKPQEVFVSA